MPSFFPILLIILLLNVPLAVTRGDLLKRTMCYCGTDNHRIDPPALVKGEDNVGDPQTNVKRSPIDVDALQTFWYSFEYYNVHLNHTFVMEETCASNFDRTRHAHGSDCWDYLGSHHKYCKHFRLRPHDRSAGHGRTRHHFCYHFHRNWRQDSYSFDGQTRHVSEFPLFQLGYEVREICEPLCREKFDKPLMKGNWYWRSSVSTVFDEADMCDGCA
ncbi:hypothetical protein MMC22_011701 [Lobaria immixta]|nr:hypothetical protein [Lobaria immixta]